MEYTIKYFFIIQIDDINTKTTINGMNPILEEFKYITV